jgi:hypothetical protein
LLIAFFIDSSRSKSVTEKARVSFKLCAGIWEAVVRCFWTSAEATYATRIACIQQRQQAITSMK